MARLDLDAARAEYDDEDHLVVLAGAEWTLPAKFPVIVAQYMATGQIDKAVSALFSGEGDPVAVVAPLLNDDDLDRIMRDLYGVEPAEGASAAVVTPTTRTNGGGGRAKATSRR